MRKFILFIILFPINNLFGQQCEQEKITIKYKNGYEVFIICKNPINNNYDTNHEYFWFSDIGRQIKSTKRWFG